MQILNASWNPNPVDVRGSKVFGSSKLPGRKTRPQINPGVKTGSNSRCERTLKIPIAPIRAQTIFDEATHVLL